MAGFSIAAASQKAGGTPPTSAVKAEADASHVE